MSMTFTWFGNAAYRLETPGMGPIYIDPWIEGNPNCPIALSDIEDAAVILVSHGHPGHFGNSVFIAARTGATYVSNPAVADYVRNARLLPAAQVVGLEMGKPYRIGTVEITLYQINHPPQDVVSYAPAEPNCASVIRADGVALFHAGDIGMDSAMSDIGKSARPTHAIVPLTGGDVSLSAERALSAAAGIGAQAVIPTCRANAYEQKAAAFKVLAADQNVPYTIVDPQLGSPQALQ